MEKYVRLANVLGESELCLLEDALKNFHPAYLDNNPHGQQLKEQLQDTLLMARGWAHQFGKTDRER